MKFRLLAQLRRAVPTILAVTLIMMPSSLMMVAASDSSSTITDIVVGSSDFDTLEAAVVKAGLAGILGDASASLTVFAPTDAAFDRFPQDILGRLLQDEYLPHLVQVLLYHVLSGKVPSSAISDGDSKQALNQEFLRFTVDGGKIIVNSGGAEVESPDIGAANGVIHVIDRVLTPSWVGKTMLDVAVDAGSFTTVLSLASSFNEIVTNLDLSDELTFFAPPNAVFEALAQNSPKIFAALPDNPDVLRRILGAHIISGINTAARIPNGISTFTAFSGDELTIVKTDSGSITVNGVLVAQADVFAENGLIHILDGLIIPDGLDLNDLVDDDGKPEAKFLGPDPSGDLLPLGLCEGDCDSDDDCEDGLVCVQRTIDDPIPGCSGSLNTYADFCVPGNGGGGGSGGNGFPQNFCNLHCGPNDDCSGDLVIRQQGRGIVWIVPC